VKGARGPSGAPHELPAKSSAQFGGLKRDSYKGRGVYPMSRGEKPHRGAFAPDLIFYQAGADVHVDDPFGGLLTTEQMRARDRAIFSLARELSIPLTWNLAGGYQIESDGSIPRVIQLHLNTFEEALRAWQLL
jgi:hypothetical protein